jgi:hypothetical protein
MSAPAIARRVEKDLEIRDSSRQDIPKLADVVRQNPAQQDIANLAYGIWQEKGCPNGTAEEDWLEAEQGLLSNS